MSEPNRKAIEGEAREEFNRYLENLKTVRDTAMALNYPNTFCPADETLVAYCKRLFPGWYEDSFNMWCEDKATRQ